MTPILSSLRAIGIYLVSFLLQPLDNFRGYSTNNLQADVIAGLTVAIVLLPQAIAYALIAELPPATGLFTAVVGAVVGALWGSSNQVQTGPTNALSLLVLSVLLPVATPGTPEFLVAAGMTAVMVGLFQLVMGVARLGALVNFVSDSVIVGFTAGAGVLIAMKQLRPLFGVDFAGRGIVATTQGIVTHLPEAHAPTLLLGLGTMLLIVLLRTIHQKLPATLISLIAASTAVYVLGLHHAGVQVIGELPSRLPPLADLPVFNFDLVARLSTGALAAGAIGLIQTMAVARSISTHTDQRLDSNQEFVGQGLANIAAGFFSGYPCAGSFGRSAVNFEAGARTSLAALLSGLFVVIAMLTLAPVGAYLPRAALAGVLIVVAYGLVDRDEIARILHGTRGDAGIMVVTFLGTLFLPIEFAVLTGILMSLGYYILQTSSPQVHSVVPDDNFQHFMNRPDKPQCPQLGILDIHGDLYFGAVNHVEEEIRAHKIRHDQRFLLLRMHGVNHCDFSGVRMLESIVHTYREQGGDVFMTRVRDTVLKFMQSTNFYHYLGEDHFLNKDKAIEHLFYKVLDPAICIYETEVRVFQECQNLPRPDYPVEIPTFTEIPAGTVPEITPEELWGDLHDIETPLHIIDVREPREFEQGHILPALSIPLPTLLSDTPDLPEDRPVVLVCRSGRRSTRAAHQLDKWGHDNVLILKGGMLAWETAELLEAVAEEQNHE